MEIFKDIKGYEGNYQISNNGNIRNSKGSLLKLSTNSDGYLQITLWKEGRGKTRKVHQLVAETFLNHNPDKTNKIVVDHINNIHADNRLENLQLISNRENSSKDKVNCTSKYTGVVWHRRDKRWLAQIRIEGKVKHLGSFKDEVKASEAYQNAVSSLTK